jgi:hypothetical protein
MQLGLQVYPPMPHRPLQDSPLAQAGTYDLATTAGRALLRRFDAEYHRMPAEAREDALRALELVLPLAERAAGLLVLPGGALAQRQDDTILVCDPASAIGLTTGAAALRKAIRENPAAVTIRHDADGLRIGDGKAAAQSATLMPATTLASFLPQVTEWRGAAMVHWYSGGAVVWEMVPAPPPLALAVSLTGESLGIFAALPRWLWAMDQADDRFQHLSSGLFAHLDDVLANEISDTLRFALIARETDGDGSLASRLADGLGLLPAAFTADFTHITGMAPLLDWPNATAHLRPGQALIGIAAGADGRWDAPFRHGVLELLRRDLPPDALLVAETPAASPAPLHSLAADRLARTAATGFAALFTLGERVTPQALLHTALALAHDVALLVAVPAWGLCHRLAPLGQEAAGNGAAYGLGAALEFFDEN